MDSGYYAAKGILGAEACTAEGWNGEPVPVVRVPCERPPGTVRRVDGGVDPEEEGDGSS